MAQHRDCLALWADMAHHYQSRLKQRCLAAWAHQFLPMVGIILCMGGMGCTGLLGVLDGARAQGLELCMEQDGNGWAWAGIGST